MQITTVQIIGAVVQVLLIVALLVVICVRSWPLLIGAVGVGVILVVLACLKVANDDKNAAANEDSEGGDNLQFRFAAHKEHVTPPANHSTPVPPPPIHTPFTAAAADGHDPYSLEHVRQTRLSLEGVFVEDTQDTQAAATAENSVSGTKKNSVDSFLDTTTPTSTTMATQFPSRYTLTREVGGLTMPKVTPLQETRGVPGAPRTGTFRTAHYGWMDVSNNPTGSNWHNGQAHEGTPPYPHIPPNRYAPQIMSPFLQQSYNTTPEHLQDQERQLRWANQSAQRVYGAPRASTSYLRSMALVDVDRPDPNLVPVTPGPRKFNVNQQYRMDGKSPWATQSYLYKD